MLAGNITFGHDRVVDDRWRIFKELVRALKVVLVLFVLWLPVSIALSGFLVVEKTVTEPGAIVVLAGSAEYIERTALAASLFREGRAEKVIITNDGRQGGWDAEQQRNPYFVESARSNLIAGGVPKEALVILPRVTNGTDEEAIAVLDFAASERLTSLELVTSPYHTRRALWIFEIYRDRRGMDCLIGVTTTRGGPLDPSSYIWWTSLDGWRLVVSEYAKMTSFWMAG